jgi:hypothetical protein
MPTYSSEELNRLRQEGKSQTDWKWVKSLTDSDIDFSDLPELDEESFKSAKVTKKSLKKLFKTQNNWQRTSINHRKYCYT